MSTYAVQLHCESCGRRDVWEASVSLGDDEKIVLAHVCSESTSGPWQVRRERK